ncbi:hypothetical protein PAMP_007751 [Pampus punctatissimus]
MSLPKRRKFRTFALLFCVITFTTFLFSYTFRDPSLYFFKHAFRLSDNFFSKGLCACRQCMTELEDDPWFAERFNQTIHPLMTRENSILSDETFKWWQEMLLTGSLMVAGQMVQQVQSHQKRDSQDKRAPADGAEWLQSEKQPANYSEVVEELFQVIPDEVLFMDASPERCRICSVVGNSGNLKGSQYGGIIDSSDFIISLSDGAQCSPSLTQPALSSVVQYRDFSSHTCVLHKVQGLGFLCVSKSSWL